MTRLLIFTPTYGDGPRPETLASVEAQVFDGELIHEVSRHNPFGDGDARNVTAQFQRARALLLDGEFDGLLTVEHDMAIPADAAQKLWETPAPVVYGVYMLRHGSQVINAWQKTGQRNLGMSLSLYPKQLAHYRQRWVGEVSGVGNGCTLIRRAVMERIPFRPGENGGAPDIPFARDCLRQGIQQMARFDVACGHYDAEEGRWLMPFEGGGEASTRALALVDVNVQVDGQSKPLVKDRHYTLPLSVASELQRAGYVRITHKDTFVAPAEHPAGEQRVAERETGDAQRKRKARKKAD